MNNKLSSGLLGLVFLTSMLVLSFGAQVAQNPNDKVKSLRVPNSGLQPQALVDERGMLHLIYFSGEPGGGDIFYLRRDSGKTDFSPPIRINSEPNSAVAVGTIRGAHFAIGKNGRIHVAWNGPHKAGREAPMFYARMNDARTAFEPQRNVMQFSGGLDGGGSIAADKDGNVYVVWHGKGGKEGEEYRRVWIAKSADDGKTLSREVATWNEPTGACGCCGMRAFVDAQGRVHLLYRAAKEKVNRDMYLLTSVDRGKSFSGMLIDKWKLDVCPMSSAALAEDASRLLAAWETQGQVYFAAFDLKKLESASPVQAISSTGKRKHPVIATNGRGETLFVWTEGTGWKKGGSLAWQLYDSSGKPTGEMGQAPGIPVWSFAAVVTEKDGSFTIIY
jgi:hypothetical protein